MHKALGHQSVDGLMQAHRELSRRVAELERRAFLTPSEQQEARELKKQKLATKDAIVAMVSSDRQ